MATTNTPSILVVDDEQDIRLLLCDLLSEKGYRITEACSREEAVDRLAAAEFDLALVDKNLPDGSGMEVVAEIRHLGYQTEIIILTGYSDLESAIEAFRFSVFRYIKKPFDLNLLSVEIAGALRTHQLKQHLQHRTIELEVANRQLKQGEKRFRDLADLLPGIVIETDGDGIPIFVNRAGLESSGYTLEAFRERFADATLVNEADRDKWQDHIRQVLDGSSPPIDEYRICRVDGSEMPVLMQAAPIAEFDATSGLRAVLLDITLRKRAEAALKDKESELQLVQKMEAVGSLAGGVAHDFNNMLSIIRGFCDVILLDVDEQNPLREDVESIVDAAERAADLTRQLLAFGRKQIVVPQIIDLNAALRSMEKMIRRLVREDIIVDIRLHNAPLFILIDKGQIEQVILNLVVNARDAMLDGGHLVVGTSKPTINKTGMATLTVADNGCGIDEKTRQRIFEPFFTTKAKGKGTGLGLATVYGIVQQNRGTIHVESRPNHGTRFDIAFPIAEGEPSRDSFAPPDMGEGGGTETILVVEDESALLNAVAKILKSYGYTVLTAAHSGDALLICEQHPNAIDLLLVDVVMPRLNGPELVARLHPQQPTMKVLYMSGYSDFTVVRQVMTENLDCFIAKPFSAMELAHKIQSVLHDEG